MTFFTDDEHTIAQDTREVLAASSLLEITEFHLFELAYQRWFGRQGKERELEAWFARYMFAARAPFWVRQFCREVATMDSRGALDPLEFGVHPRVVPDTPLRRVLRHVSVMLMVVVALHLIAILISVT